MQALEAEFFEEYKRTERVCSDMYRCESGVSEYIGRMEQRGMTADETYRKLKHLRWLRNRIAHDEGGADVTEGDLADLRAFHRALLEQSDPLTVRAKRRAAAKPAPRTMRHTPRPAPKKSPAAAWMVVGLFLAIAAIVIYFFIR